MLHFPSSKKRKFYDIKLAFAIMNNYIQNNNVNSNQERAIAQTQHQQYSGN